MRKLFHQSSDTIKTEESKKKCNGSGDLLAQTNLGGSEDISMTRELEGKILLMEERNKSILAFYENKISQLKKVLTKQGETKFDLMRELASLSLENQKQNKYVHQLKAQLEGGAAVEPDLLKQSQRMRNQPERQRNEGRFNSRSRGKNLFSSRNFGKESTRIALKKCKSTEFLESEYFSRETATNIERNIMSPNEKKLRGE